MNEFSEHKSCFSFFYDIIYEKVGERICIQQIIDNVHGLEIRRCV